MTNKSILFLASALILTSSQFNNATAQVNKYRTKAYDPAKELGYDKKLRWADGLFKEGSYYNAADYYAQLLQEQPRNPYLVHQLAVCQEKMRDYANAAGSYGNSYELSSKLYPLDIYNEAINLKMAGKYKESIAAFNEFIAENPKTYKKLKKRALVQIQGSEMALNSLDKPGNATVKNLGPNINSAYTELSPLPLGDTALLFSTMHSNNVIDQTTEKRSDYVSRFMVSHKNRFTEEKDTFTWALPFDDGKFNDSRYHVGNGTFSEGGDRFYFTKCTEGDSNTMNCKIYVSNFQKSKWSTPQELGFGINESGSSSTQPWITKIGKKEILFFSSNRKLQSRGGYDIWYSVYDPKQNTYRRPQNAGKQINTEDDEMTPYYDSKENKLYFASNGWITLGGFDIFSADGGPSRYTNVRNLGVPINSSADELYYVKDPVGEKGDGYVVSNRFGSIALKNPTCCDDIWRVQNEPKLLVDGKVVDQKTQKLVNNVVVKMVDENGDLKTFNSTDGNFEFATPRGHDYTITADKPSYTTTHANVSTQGIKRSAPDNTVNVTLYVDRFNIDSNFRLDNVFYAFNKADIDVKASTDLDKLTVLLKDNPSLDVEIQSYTDGKGTDAYNLDLSQKRAQAVVDYLVGRGVERSRLSAKGFGKSNPVAPNTVKGKDNPDGRQLNRRTEFRIVSDVPSRRVIFNSAKPGTIGSQSEFLNIDTEKFQKENGDDLEDKPASTEANSSTKSTKN